MVSLVATLMSQLSCAQKNDEVKIPDAVRSAFQSKFPDVDKPDWEMESSDEYEASFKLQGKETSACFDNSGHWLETETEIKVSDLPEAVRTALQTDFADYKVTEASEIESAANGKGFEAEIKKGKEVFDVVFSPEGKMLSNKNAGEEDEEEDED